MSRARRVSARFLLSRSYSLASLRPAFKTSSKASIPHAGAPASPLFETGTSLSRLWSFVNYTIADFGAAVQSETELDFEAHLVRAFLSDGFF
jgi:hypothetical protein